MKAQVPEGRLEQGKKLNGCRWCSQPLVKYHGVLLCRFHDAPEPEPDPKQKPSKK